MLQIAIWGICALLIVKGLDVLHQQHIAESAGHKGNETLALVTLLVSVGAAIGLFLVSREQASVGSDTSPYGSMSAAQAEAAAIEAERALGEATR
jgi:hypothetical protein